MPTELAILYFAWVRERIGMEGETIAHPGCDCTVGELVGRLAVRSAGHREAFADTSRLRAALDQRHVPLDAPLGEARELAIFPPVTGG